MKQPEALFILSLVLLCASCSSSYETKDPRKTIDVYQREFGSLPPSSVSGLQLKQVVIGDTMMEWLLFNSDKATFDRILASKGFVPMNSVEFMTETGGPNSPDEWKPDKRLISYKKEDWNRDQIGKDEGTRAWIGYDERAGIVYFSRSQWN